MHDLHTGCFFSGLDDDFYKNLAAGAGEVTESDISEADPVAMANTMDVSNSLLFHNIIHNQSDMPLVRRDFILVRLVVTAYTNTL